MERPNTITANGDPNGDIKPNSGASVLDQEATGERHEVLSEWQKQQGIDTSKQVKIVKVAHMRYQHPDMPTITKFLKDFGMHIAKATGSHLRIW